MQGKWSSYGTWHFLLLASRQHCLEMGLSSELCCSDLAETGLILRQMSESRIS
jgi:hypothetical protein